MKSRFVVLSVAAIGLLSPFAFAQDDPRKAHAEALYNEAASLHDAGKESDALAKWREAYGVYPTPNILFSIAREEQLLGQNLAALRDYRAAIKDPLLNLKFQSVAREHVAELERSSCRVEVHAPAGATVSIDGVAVDASITIDVAAGSHTVVATLSGNSDTRAINAPTGQLVKVVFDSIGNRVTEPPKTEQRTKVFPPPTGAIILGGVGLVGLGLGVGFGLGSQSNRSTFDDHSCSTSLDPTCHDTAASVRRDATISWISYVAGGALLAGGVVWWVVAPRKESVSVALVPSFTPNSPGFQLRGTF